MVYLNNARRKILLNTPHLESASGNVCTFSTDLKAPLKECKASFSPVQNLNGYDSPWPVGGGKNLFECKLNSGTFNGINFNVQSDGKIVLSGANDGALKDVYINTVGGSSDTSYRITLNTGEYRINGISGGSTSTYRLYIAIYEDAVRYVGVNDGDVSFTLSEPTQIAVFVRIYPGLSISGVVTISPMIRLAVETDDTYAPYSNICPITGRSRLILTRSGANASDTRSIVVVWETVAGTAYGGTLDVTTGVLTVDRRYTTLGAEIVVKVTNSVYASFQVTLPTNAKALNEATTINCISSVYKGLSFNGTLSSDDFCVFTSSGNLQIKDTSQQNLSAEDYKSANSNVEFVYMLATPITYQLTPVEIKTLLGVNNIWSNANENIEVKFWKH